MNIPGRIKNLRDKFAENEIDGILISEPDNRYYLSGFLGSAGYLLINAQKLVLAVDFRYVEQAKQQAPEYEIFRITGQLDWFIELAGNLKIKRLGFEAGNLTYAFYRQLTELLQKNSTPFQLVPTDNLVEVIRSVKEPEEIALIKKAVSLSDSAIDHIQDVIRPGFTEMETAWQIERFMRENGSETVPFELIVGAGPNAALPHAHPGQYKIKEGEPVVIDIGARCGGYTSDITRTIYIGSPDATFRKVYNIVLGAQLAAIAIVKEGMTGEEADGIARAFIQEAGYGEHFGHGLGHGVGLATHEFPRLGMRSKDKLINDMVFTIEPGIYLPGWGGVRIEDTVVMAEGKVELLSKAIK